MGRQYARGKVLRSKRFIKTVEDLSSSLPRGSWAVIGGLAVAYYANPPVTVDVDILFDDYNWSVDDMVLAMETNGWQQERKLGFSHRTKGLPRCGFAFERNGVVLDVLFVGKDKFLRSAIANAQVMNVKDGIRVRVVRAEDLIIMKSLVSRDKDTDDIGDLYIQLKDVLDIDYIDRMINRLE